MNPVVVCDSSTVVAVLLDGGPSGEWSSRILSGQDLAAPALLPFEVSNVIRRHELSGRVSADQAAQAHGDLLDLPIQLWPYETVASRVRQLRKNLTAYDAAYVALAELLGCPLVTLDTGVAGAPGLLCQIRTP
jgi:predicted nucleic acid-binding protein